MPERSFFFEYIFVPIVGWLGYLQRDKTSRSTCKATHTALCDKLDTMHKDIREVRGLLIEHLGGGPR